MNEPLKRASKAETARPLDPSVLQNRASDPSDSIWVGASAGSGKTKVLTDRVLRLLLPREDGQQGTKPHKILCLTFTKAGAGEMALRVSKRLSQWAVLADEELAKNLHKLLGRPPQQNEQKAARRLFADVIDAPGKLNILTIHSFCQSVLGRFPLEAGLPPHFEVLEEGQAHALLHTAFTNMLRSASPAAPLKNALDALSAEVSEDQLFALVRNMASERRQFLGLLQRHFDEDGLYAALCALLGMTPGQTPDDILLQGCADSAFDGQGLLKAARALLQGSLKTDQPRGQALCAWLESPQNARLDAWEDYQGAFFTAKGTIIERFATKAVTDIFPQTIEILQQEARRLEILLEHSRRAACAQNMRDLAIVGRSVLVEYDALKSRRGALDFDDLIGKTLDLLQSMPHWVLFKLDQGLDHILIDEAQDTNPEQWQIIAALCEEFYTGIAAKDGIHRTIFTVGDIKQSIYSFQRAAPAEFSRMKAYFEQKIQDSEQNFAEIPMNISFRSAKSVLQAVDLTFGQAEAARGMGGEPVLHTTFRDGQEGLVELAPLFSTPDSDKPDYWQPPIEIVESTSGAALLADHIGKTIRGWLDRKEFLPARGRAVEAGDILILVRTRTAFFNQIVRALKVRNIPVSGVDRMVLRDQLAVQDAMAAAQFALLPEDDLTLATLLKSPFLGWSEDQLMQLAAYRPLKTSLWSALSALKGPEITWLQDLIDCAAFSAPYAFFSALLNQPCPGHEYSGMQAMRGRLGDDAQDPLDELLNSALAYEAAQIPNLQGFVQAHVQGDSDIKRQMDESGGKVRIMTVHGAKGLQAPIVILPDTTRTARHITNKPESRLLWPAKTDLPLPLWCPRKDLECKLFSDTLATLQNRQDEEYRRLLYVAMTRAEDRLYIFGYEGKKSSLADSWYHFIQAGLTAHTGTETLENGNLRLHNPQIKEPDKTSPNQKDKQSTASLPSWLRSPAPPEAHPPRPLMPSRPSAAEPGVFSPLSEERTHRFRRGTLTHRLLQFLPSLPSDLRQKAAQEFLDKNGHDLKDDTKHGIIKEILDIFGQKQFAPLFEAGSLAEIPVTGLLPDGRLISGQIDRLLITPSAIFIIDYKTNRPPPEHEKDVSAAYKVQMQAYVDVLKAIYPGRAVHAALLWTDGPRLMPLTLS